MQKLNEKGERRLSSSFLCTPAGVRTLDPLIKSQMLYQLSYKRVHIRYFQMRVQR